MQATAPDLDTLHTSTGTLFEAPRFDSTRGLIFADTHHGGVFSVDRGRHVETLIPHRRGIAGLALHAAGGFVVSGRNVAHKAMGKDGMFDATSVLLSPEHLSDTEGFNDLTVDGAGRVYVGSLATGAVEGNQANLAAPPGAIYLIDRDGSTRMAADDIRVPNGMNFSPDGSRFYVCDSVRRLVFSFAVDPDDGTLHSRTVLLEVEPGIPDGMALAQDGSIWLAHAYAGLISRFSPEGEPISAWTIPETLVTSLCFGGSDGKSVYITTGAAHGHGSAAIFVTETDVPGLELPGALVSSGGAG